MKKWAIVGHFRPPCGPKYLFRIKLVFLGQSECVIAVDLLLTISEHSDAVYLPIEEIGLSSLILKTKSDHTISLSVCSAFFSSPTEELVVKNICGKR